MPSSDSDSDSSCYDGGDFGTFFDEPEGFRPPPAPPSFSEHRMRAGHVLRVRTVGSHPLYGHLVWNAGRISATYLETHASRLVRGKDILELGAGAGLPSMVCALTGARTVVCTDYPDAELVENIRINARVVEEIIRKEKEGESPLSVEGYKWGESVGGVLGYLPLEEQGENKGFDLLILADVIYNHPQHANLLKSVKMAMKRNKDAVAVVVFTPYQPWLMEKIVRFFPLAEENGFVVEKVFEEVLDSLLFEDDPGDEKLRRTVFGYELRWKDEKLESD